MKGQVTFTNLIAATITLLMYFMFALPVLTPIIEDAVVYQNAHPTSFSDAVILLMYAVPFILLIGIIMTILSYAMPQREGTGGRY